MKLKDSYIVPFAVRTKLFNALFPLWTAVIAVLGAPLLLGPRRGAVLLGRVWSSGALGLARWIGGVRYRLVNTEGLPRHGAALIVMKHESAWETFAFQQWLDDPAVVLKKELMDLPFFSWFARKIEVIVVDREASSAALRSLVAAALKARDQQRQIVLFPEGTRAEPGTTPDLTVGLAALYKQLALPVIPVSLDTGRFWHTQGGPRRAGEITLIVHPPIPPGLERAAMMKQVHSAINAQIISPQLS